MPTITTAPLRLAADTIRRKTVVGSPRTSEQWEMQSADIRMRSMFSAQVENERILSEAQDRLRARLELARRDGRTMDRGVFIEEMRDIVSQSGYRRPADVRRGGLRDLKSTRRLGLIFDMNVAQSQGYAKWKSGMTKVGLENEPAQELVRIRPRMEARNWPVIWRHQGGEFYGGIGSNKDYPWSAGRMIALKTDPIWTLISRFGTPWPPFDWGSGMGLRSIDRRTAESYGLLTPDTIIEPLDKPFNDELEASLADIPEDGRTRIAEALQGEVEVVGDKLRLLPSPKMQSRVFLPPAILTALIGQAATALIDWPEAKLAKLEEALSETVAWQRYVRGIELQGGTVSTSEGLLRAMAQFLSGPDGKEAIREVRKTSWRDAFWSPADFRDLESILERGVA